MTDVEPRGHGDRQRWFVVSVLALAVAFMIYQQVVSNISRNDAVSTAQTLAEPIDQLCRDDPTARRRIGDARCDQAAEVQQNPSAAAVAPRDGADGRDGRDGRGITATAVVDGQLLVTYTDGRVENVGQVAGPNGEPGPSGRGITSATVDEDGELVLTFTDGATAALGRVVGAVGATGRGIDRTEARDGRLVVFYDDAPDVAVDVGPLPSGPTGAAGRGVATLDLDLATCTVTIYYDDGTNEVKPVTGCDESPSETGGPPTSSAGSVPLFGG